MITLSLCMIVKDEEEVIGRCLDTVKDIVDEIIIVDTGSNDKTKEIVKCYTDNLYEFEWIDDFSAARNFSFSKASKDYIIWLDADDVILEKDRNNLINLKENLDNNIDMVIMAYDVAYDKNDNVTFSYSRERIVKRKMQYKWIGEVHEVIEHYGNIFYSDIAITHKKIKQNDPQRNLKIFENMISMDKTLDTRQKYYYARELYFNNRLNEASEKLNEFINLSDGWIENKISACKDLADCYFTINRAKDGLMTLFRSFEFDEPRAEICCDIGFYFMNIIEYKKAIFWYEFALTRVLDINSGGFIIIDCYNYIPYMQLCVCYDRLGDKKRACEYNEKAGKIKPLDENYLYNKIYFDNLSKQVN